MALTARTSGGRGRPATVGLREKILDRAAQIFARHDFHEVLMDDVARDCGVAKGTLYRYFPSKRALYLGVMFESMDRLHQTLREAVAGAGRPVAKLARLVYALLDHFWERRFFITLIHRIEDRQGDPDSREWLRRRAQIARLIQTTLEEAVAAGEMRAVDSRMAAEMLLGMLRGVNRYRAAQDTLSGVVGGVLEVFVRGVGTEQGRRSLDRVHLPARRGAQSAADGGRASVHARTTRAVTLGGPLVAALAALVLAACSDQGAGASAAHPRDHAVPVRAVTAVVKNVPVQLHAIGTVEAYATVEIKSRVEGQVAEVHFREGQAVREGELLFSIDKRPFEAALRQAEANLARDRAEASNAEAEADRMRRLLAQKIVSQDEHDQATTRAATLRATVKADEALVESARLQVTFSEVRSPLTGRIGRILVDRGNIVKPNETSMAVVNQIRPIYVAFSVPQQNLAEVRHRAAEGSLTVDVSPGAAGTQPISGRLSFIDNQVDSGTGTLLLKGEFANDDEALWPGQFVDTFITLSVLRNAVVAPAAAVQTGQQGEYLYTIAAGDSAELRPVRTGVHVGGEVVIEDGLRAGERVVTDGQLQLAPGSHVEVKNDDASPRATAPAQAG